MTWSIQKASALFKNKFGKLSENAYNSANPILGTVKKSYNFTGKRLDVPNPLGFAGGVGSGTKPFPGVADYAEAMLYRKKVYASIEVDRESIKASENDEGAFVRLTKNAVAKGVESYNRNASRILFNDGTGKLGTISNVVDDTGGAYTLTISDATWKEANFEENDQVNIESGNTDRFEITEVLETVKKIKVQRVSGSQVPVNADVIFMQGSENNDPMGLKGVLHATSGSLYTVPVSRRWKSHQVSGEGGGVTTDILNKLVLGVEKHCGKNPNLIVASYEQYMKIQNLLEDKKSIQINPRDKSLTGRAGWKALAFDSVGGEIPIIYDRFMDPDKIYALNKDFIELHHAPDFGWFDDDGTVFMRSPDRRDVYTADYGGYWEAYIVPPFHGALSDLAV